MKYQSHTTKLKKIVLIKYKMNQPIDMNLQGLILINMKKKN